MFFFFQNVSERSGDISSNVSRASSTGPDGETDYKKVGTAAWGLSVM